MSRRTPFTALSRSLGAQLRQSPVAGPSRIPIYARGARSLTTETEPTPIPTSAAPTPSPASRPAPAPTPKRVPTQSTTKLVVRTSKPMTSVLHAYAVLRSIEDTYGPVLDFQVGKDPDSLQPTNILFFTMTEPVTIDSNRLNEIPAPRSSLHELERYGGPSLEDIRSILRSDPSRGVPSSNKGRGQGQAVITFEVEARKRPKTPRPVQLRRPTAMSVKQDLRLADALEKFEGGFFGGFAGIGARYKPIFELHRRNVEAKEERVKQGAEPSGGGNRRRGPSDRKAGGNAAPTEEAAEPVAGA